MPITAIFPRVIAKISVVSQITIWQQAAAGILLAGIGMRVYELDRILSIGDVRWQMRIAIIIPAFNEERLIVSTLRCIHAALAAFERRNWSFELVVCDNNSSDCTAELARGCGARVVFEPINQIARARNTGAKSASADWLIFIDADSRPSAELFEDVAVQIESGNCLAGGSTLALDGHHAGANFVTGLWNRASRICRWVAGSFIFCDAAAFREIRGFNENLFASEEIDLSRRLKAIARAEGKRVVILHRHPLVTSARKLHLYSIREHLWFMAKVVFTGGRALGNRQACHTWYDGRR